MKKPLENSYVVLDFETGGLDCKVNPITEFAGIALKGTTLEGIVQYDNKVKPYPKYTLYDEKAILHTKHTLEYLEKNGIPLEELVQDIIELFKMAHEGVSARQKPIVVAHNAQFDVGFLQQIFIATKQNLASIVAGTRDIHGNFQPAYIDTVQMAKECWGDQSVSSYNLQVCCNRAGVDLVSAHQAINDTESLAELFRFFISRMRNDTAGGSITESEVVKYRGSFEF
ncbi:3'-5' exonuclease [bacterium]|nr:3'-5' exonuclease [bacterium]